jgi:hypothetical protein
VSETTKTYTEREVVLRERKAAKFGVLNAAYMGTNAQKAIESAYPLPRRRKVVEIDGAQYRLTEDGKFLERMFGDHGDSDVALTRYASNGVHANVLNNCRALIALNGQVWEDVP